MLPLPAFIPLNKLPVLFAVVVVLLRFVEFIAVELPARLPLTLVLVVVPFELAPSAFEVLGDDDAGGPLYTIS